MNCTTCLRSRTEIRTAQSPNPLRYCLLNPPVPVLMGQGSNQTIVMALPIVDANDLCAAHTITFGVVP
jgi:hypothetical protein